MTVKGNQDMVKVSQMLAHLRKHLRITSNDLDSELTQKLLAAVAAAEHHIGKAIIPASFTDTHSLSPSFPLRAPVISVSSVEVDGVAIDSSLYSVSGQVLTLDDSVTGSKVSVVYKAGYDPVPADMLNAILLHASALFNNPLDSVETLPKASSFLLRPYRSWGVIDNGE